MNFTSDYKFYQLLFFWSLFLFDKKIIIWIIHLVRTQNYEKLTFLTSMHTLKCAYKGGKNTGFAENFAYVINGWSPGWISESHEK